MKEIMLPVGAGELLDRLTILEIKARHAVDARRAAAILVRLEAVNAAAAEAGLTAAAFQPALLKLRTINAALWDLEDELRTCEAEGDFGARFVALARGVYQNNDRRALVKNEIDERSGSAMADEKVYATRKG